MGFWNDVEKVFVKPAKQIGDGFDELVHAKSFAGVEAAFTDIGEGWAQIALPGVATEVLAASEAIKAAFGKELGDDVLGMYVTFSSSVILTVRSDVDEVINLPKSIATGDFGEILMGVFSLDELANPAMLAMHNGLNIAMTPMLSKIIHDTTGYKSMFYVDPAIFDVPFDTGGKLQMVGAYVDPKFVLWRQKADDSQKRQDELNSRHTAIWVTVAVGVVVLLVVFAPMFKRHARR